MVETLWEPVRARLSPGGARARLGHTGAHFADTAAELEGFARPLWGLVPLAAGGGQVGWEPILRGLTSGTDPDHAEFWGYADDRDQRVVEMAAIGFALALVPEQVWEPLDGRARLNLTQWLGRANAVAVPDNNWHFFRVMVNEGLARVGAAEHDPAAARHALDRLESFYLGDGWYSDGPTAQRDHYLGSAMHFYGLIYSRLAEQRDPERAQRFRERASGFAPDFAAWFAADGSALPFGRSLTYRFAQGAFWGALAFAGVEALPWGQVKGLALRHLRWWMSRPICDSDGVLTIGYGYPNLGMAEEYNSPGSPYWAMKSFLPLALPGDHPFWTTEEAPLPVVEGISVQPHAGMLLHRDSPTGHVFALSSGQEASWPRHGAAKYAKFAYSTGFGFSVPSDGYGLERGAPDSMLALSDDGDVYWRVRTTLEESRVDGERLYSRWRPWPDVEVETWLIPHPPWHIRVHRLRTQRPLWSAEGGYSLDRTAVDTAEGRHLTGRGRASAVYPAGGSGIVDLAADLDETRDGEVIRLAPNTNLLHPRTVLPVLRAAHPPGEHWLACAVFATTDRTKWTDDWSSRPEDLNNPLTTIPSQSHRYHS